VHIPRQDSADSVDCRVPSQLFGLQPVNDASDRQLITHGYLALDHDVRCHVQRGDGKLHLGTLMVGADQLNSLTLVRG